MNFSSVSFLFYFLPAALALYFLAGLGGMALQNFILLILSLVFYAWGEPVFVFALVLLGLFSYAMGLAIAKAKSTAGKKLLLILACTLDLAPLVLFKYWNFIASSVNQLIELELLPLHELAMPLGVSFFTFQILSYLFDVYRGKSEAAKNPLKLLLYVCMFPQLISGPIVRYHLIETQLDKRSCSLSAFAEGCARLVMGLAKKLILASAFATIADNIFAITRAGHNLINIPILLAWLGSIAYTLQIYLDFSSYSDMAIGLAKMLGFEFEENFNYPYTSRSISEFWRRWHISLGAWFREYVYFPLGGSKTVSISRTFKNMFAVWLLTGLWHGANWTFVLWGLLNFVVIVLERLTLLEQRGEGKGWRHVYSLLLINLGWVVFRAEDFYQLTEYIGNMFGSYGNALYGPYVLMFLKEYAPFWIIGIAISTPLAPKLRARIKALWPRLEPVLYTLFMLLLLFVSSLYLFKSGYSSFIYFDF